MIVGIERGVLPGKAEIIREASTDPDHEEFLLWLETDDLRLVSLLEEGEPYITDEEFLNRMRMCKPLDYHVAEALYDKRFDGSLKGIQEKHGINITLHFGGTELLTNNKVFWKRLMNIDNQWSNYFTTVSPNHHRGKSDFIVERA